MNNECFAYLKMEELLDTLLVNKCNENKNYKENSQLELVLFSQT